MNWLLAVFVTNTFSLLILVIAYYYMWWGGRQPSMGLWGAGWTVYMIRFLTLAGESLALSPVSWRFAGLAALGLSGFLLWAGTRSFIERPISARHYAWGLLPVLWAVVAFVPLQDYRIGAAPIFAFSALVDLFTAVTLFRYSRGVRGPWAAWVFALAYGSWAGLKLGYLFVPESSLLYMVNLIVANGLALGLAFALIALSLVEAERSARRRADRLDALAALTSAAGQPVSAEGLLATAVGEVSRVLGVDSQSGAFLLDSGGTRVLHLAGRDLGSFCGLEEGSTPHPGCPCERAMSTRQLRWPAVQGGECPASGRVGTLAVPLLAREKTLGAICAILAPERRLSDGESRALETLGRQLGAALENAQLFTSLAEEKERLELLHRLGRHLSESLETRDVAQRALDEISALAGCQHGVVLLREPDTTRLRLVALFGYDAEPVEELDRRLDLHLGDGLAGWVAENRQTAVIDDVRQDERWLVIPEVDAWVRSALSVPLVAGDELVGVLAVYGPEVAFFTEEHRRLVEAIAASVAAAVANARLYEETRRRLVREQRLNELAHALGGGMELAALIPRLLPAVFELTGADAGVVGFLDREGNIHLHPHNLPASFTDLREPAEDGVVGCAMQLGQTILAEEYGEHPSAVEQWVEAGVRSALTVPLVADDEVVGALGLFTLGRTRVFGPEDVAAAEAAARLAAVAAQRARLFAAERAARDLAERLRETALLVSSSLDLREVLELILDQVARVVPYDSGSIHVLESDATRVIAVRNLPPDEVGRRYPLGQYPYNRRLAAGEGPIVIQDVHEDGQGWVVVEELGSIRANVGVPLRVRDRVIGVLIISSHRPGAYSDVDARIVQAFAQQAAAAIENARLYADQQRRAEEATMLLEVANAINSTLKLDDILKEVTVRAARACGARRSTILLLDERGETLIPIMSQFASGEPDPQAWELFKDARYPEPVEDVPEVLRVVQNRTPLFLADARTSSLPSRWIEPFDVGSLLIVPLISRERVVGLMGLDRPEIGRAFTSEQVNMAVTIGAQAAFAIENARLYQETARRLTEAQTLQEVSAAAVSILDFEEILERVIQILRSRLGAEHVGLAVPTEDGEYLVSAPATLGRGPGSEQAVRLPVDRSVKGRVFRTGEVALIRDVKLEPEYVARAEDVRSELAVPVRAGGEVVAVLGVESRRRDAFDEGDLAFYMAVAGQLGIALENARLYRQEQQRRREAETLYRAAQALTTTLDLREVLDRILTELQQVVPYDSASVQLLEDSRLEIIGGRGFPNLDELLGLSFDISQEGSPNREVVRARSPIILSDAPLHYAGFRTEPHAAAAIRAWMGVPLLYGDRLIGMLALDKHEPGFYSREHARVALVFAGQAAIAIENARLYRRLSQALRELQDLGRLREEVVQNVSHELRTPLALIQGYTELLLSGDLGQVQPAQRSALEVIQDRTVTLARLIYNLTALRTVPRELLAMMPLSIGELLQTTLANHRRPAARAGVKLTSDLAGELPLVLGDREYLSVVFSHLIDNAIKFSPDGGLVRVRAWADKESVHVAVEDQGIGIASEHLSRIFERFYQADGSTTRRFGGMGIGLALVWEIVEAHRGSVMVESEQGKGSTFVVSLPHAEEQLT